MSYSTSDDVHAAEQTAALLAEALRRALAAVEADDDIGDEYGNALDDAHAAVATWAAYCRPTCRYRERGECWTGESEPGFCGCPCNHKTPAQAEKHAPQPRQPQGAQRALILDVPDDAWQDGDIDDGAPPGHRLVAAVTINDTPMWLEAYLVVPGADPQQTFVDDENVGLIHHAVAADGPWATTLIGGRAYVQVATPQD